MSDPFAPPDYSVVWPMFMNGRDWAIMLRDLPTAVEFVDHLGIFRRAISGRPVILYDTSHIAAVANAPIAKGAPS
jgi:hypothetical protein